MGSTTLAAAVDASATEIRVLDPEPFLWQFDKTLGDAFGDHLNTAMLGQELIRYKAVSGKAPWRCWAASECVGYEGFAPRGRRRHRQAERQLRALLPDR